MALSRKAVGLIVALMILSLTGLVILQTSLLSNAWDLEEQTFRRNALTAISAAADRMETKEAAFVAYSMIADTDSTVSLGAYRIEADSAVPDSLRMWKGNEESPLSARLDSNVLVLKARTPQHVIVQLCDSMGFPDTTLLDTAALEGEHLLDLAPELAGGNLHVIKTMTDSATSVWCVQAGTFEHPPPMFSDLEMRPRGRQLRIDVSVGDSARFEFVDEIVNRLALAENLPIEKRLDTAALDSLVRYSLREAGIELEPIYGVMSRPGDSVLLASSTDYDEDLKNSDLSTRLFPRDIFAPRNDLMLFFPDRSGYLWQQIGPQLLATILFIAIIVFCFIYTLRVILAQRRNAGLMVDFVNNMTHEFKTPISTVALACEAILRPDVISDRSKVERFSNMIENENRRMRHQTEKILQMAALEDRDYDLQLTEIDLHEIISQALDNIALQVEHRHGRVERKLEAEKHVVLADRVHVAGIIHNLLDNANKYSNDMPVISVCTSSDGNGVFVSFEDHGVGIRDTDQKMVFDKYFRVSSGNIHDVKGFGLGLSYVKMMVEAHGGNVSLKSEYGRGTTVRLFFPYRAKAE